ncbi:hypothetical protein EYF80_003706 [Liparis tanakae]|uniref:Uncharacterized protein n=1 Tax=Liparis tanakae TaxID=230148 RepID=A0A4Z2J8S5_9TELE|nr:hypothetical protein EYF80_003706 [Liparis tanakae]
MWILLDTEQCFLRERLPPCSSHTPKTNEFLKTASIKPQTGSIGQWISSALRSKASLRTRRPAGRLVQPPFTSADREESNTSEADPGPSGCRLSEPNSHILQLSHTTTFTLRRYRLLTADSLCCCSMLWDKLLVNRCHRIGTNNKNYTDEQSAVVETQYRAFFLKDRDVGEQ